MGKVPYLSPQFRNLRTEQIGPSSHKNEYNNGVLVSNWSEDRFKSTNGVEAKGAMASATSYQSDFAGGSKGRRTMTRAPDLGCDLLFGHSATPAAAAAVSALPPKQVSAIQKKRDEWKRDVDPDAPTMVSTKKGLMDSVGDLVKRDKSVLASASTAKHAASGKFSHSFVGDHRQTGLRL
jgi:hypothetical protein